MKRINVLESGIIPDGGCVSERLSALIASVGEDTELYFPAGRYYISKPVEIKGKRRLTLRGDGAVIITHFTPWDDPRENNNGFVCSDCRELTITGFVCTTDNPIGCAGRVTAKDEAAHTYDVRIDDQFPITGWEHFWGTDTCDDEGTPDYVIETYDRITTETLKDDDGKRRVKFTGTRYTLIGDNLIRVFMPENFDLSRLRIGHRVLYRYLIYGNTLFQFSDCHDVILSHIEIERCSSMGAVIYPRSSNFTFEDFNIRVPVGSAALYSANADGIHIVGLSGYLHMKNCKFRGLGDDALNIHSQAGEVAEYDRASGRMRCICRDRQMNEAPLGLKWAQEGDLIRVYERSTFLEKGTFRIGSYSKGRAVIGDVTGSEPAVGDILANDSFFASVRLDGCEVMHTRARGFLLQSRNMLIENCRIYGMSLPGIIISPDVRVWYEVGPSDNVEIRNCSFEKCAVNGSAANLGAIVVKAAHDSGASDYPAGVHTNLRIKDNRFKNCGSSGIFVSAAKGIEIGGNDFEGCKVNQNPSVADTGFDIVCCSCENVRIGENSTDKDAALLYKLK